MDRKRGLFFVGLFLIVFFSLVVSAADYCDIQTSCAPENTVLKLSDTTNAHAEVYDGANYNYFLCCNFTGNHTQDGNNKIFGLSSSTNAHAEIPSLTNYATNVYFGDLECSSNSGSCPAGYDIPMLSLSSTTNAHLSDFATYPIKVCCRQRCVANCTGKECGDDGCGGTCPPGCAAEEVCNLNGRCVSGEIYWGSPNDPRYAVSYLEVVPGVTQVALVVKNVDPPSGTVSFEIFEDDPYIPFISDDDEIRTGSDALIGDVDSNGTSIVYWTITQDDLSKTSDLGEFFFEVDSRQSNDLALTISGGSCVNINYCRDYGAETTCTQDTCLVAVDSVGAINEDITCGDGYVCNCFWENSTGECNAGWESVNESLGYEYDTSSLGIGICNYNENTNDDCNDGFLTYSWVADIDWPTDNSGWGSQAECMAAGGDALSCVFFDSLIETGFDDLWHYDPLFNGINSLLTECLGGSSTLQCPAKVQLSFFTLKNFVIVAVILILGYIIFKNKNFKKTKKRKSKKKAK
ncbi:MAG: hypothetical protein PVJ67_02335 [Candidatus Pacearchaeota archaeon]|jgi:hypothetical protein